MASETEDEAERKFKNDRRSPGGTLRQKNTWLNLIRASISKTNFKKKRFWKLRSGLFYGVIMVIIIMVIMVNIVIMVIMVIVVIMVNMVIMFIIVIMVIMVIMD